MSQRTAVVGAGLVGLLTAWELRLSGAEVTVIAPDVARDASYAAAGMLAPISEVQYGQQELWPIMTAARELYPEVLDRLSAATTEPTGYRDTGTVLLAHDPADREAVGELVAVLAAHGMEAEPMTSAQLRRREPALAPGTSKGWSVRSDHQVDPRQLMRCVASALDAPLPAGEFDGAGPPATWVADRVAAVVPAGTDSTDGTPAASSAPADSGALVTTADGDTRELDAVVLAPGLGYPDIAGLPQQVPVPLRPIHGDVLRLRVRPEQLLPGEDHLLGSTIRAKVAGRPVYLVPRSDGGLVLGASSREDSLAGTRTGSVQELLDDAAAVLPGIRETELVEITTRARPGTPDERPFLGEIAPGVVISTGYSRHGILLAPLGARLAAALIVSGGPDGLPERDRALLRATDPRRHAAQPTTTAS